MVGDPRVKIVENVLIFDAFVAAKHAKVVVDKTDKGLEIEKVGKVRFRHLKKSQ